MEENISYKDVYDSNHLFCAFYKWNKESAWKYKVQQYEENLLPNLCELKDDLVNGTYEEQESKPFVLKERDKIRYVIPKTVRDSVAQTSLCENVIHKATYPKIIYNNASSVKGGGIKRFRQQLERDLHRFWINHGNDGYILLIDYRKFFDNIRHEDTKDIFNKILPQDETVEMFNKIIDGFCVDVSPLSDEEYREVNNGIYNSLDFHGKYGICKDGKKILHKSIGIGSPVSCDIALYYPHEIDNYCKIVKGIKPYGRFTDDSYAIHESKEFLENLLDDICETANKRGITVNRDKTQIISLKKSFEILKTRYTLLNNGKLVKKISSSTIKREKRKLRKQREKLTNKETKIETIYQEYQSWRGSLDYYNSTQRLIEMDKFFNSLFRKEVERYKLEKRVMKKSKKLIRGHILHATKPDSVNLHKITEKVK